MADLQSLEALLQSGVELSRSKRFQEAEPIFRQVLTIEPRHTGAAYLLSICLYFTGQYRQAMHLFSQLTGPGSPLESTQAEKLVELSQYARYETLRLEYWEGLKLVDAGQVSRELKRLKLDPNSTKAFHFHLVNGLGREWQRDHGAPAQKIDARILNRSGQVILLPEFRDMDDSIGANLEAIQGGKYTLITLRDLSALEFGPLKRWITAQAMFRAGRRETVLTPLTYRDSMVQSAWGVKEGVETLVQDWEGLNTVQRAFGQKQFQSVSAKSPLSEILRIEF
jgi:protein involved in temperature-dependent protein secretion